MILMLQDLRKCQQEYKRGARESLGYLSWILRPALVAASLQDVIGALLLSKGRPGTSELADSPALTGCCFYSSTIGLCLQLTGQRRDPYLC